MNFLTNFSQTIFSEETKAALKSALTEKISLEEAYLRGVDCGKNGPNEQNCYFGIFCSQEHTEKWEHGKRDGEAEKA